jgi:hypothetical protein
LKLNNRPRRGRDSSARWTPSALLASLATLILLTGCQTTAHDKQDGPRREGGPLSASLGGSGGVALDPPKAVKDWNASFGDFWLCSKQPDQKIVVQRVRYSSGPRPVDAHVYVRRMTREERLHPAAGTSASTFYSAYGSPPDFAEHYATLKPGGTFSEHIDGTRVTQQCKDRGKGPIEGFTELVFAVKVGPAGALLHDFVIDYTSNGQPYFAKIAWSVVGCGTRTATHCETPSG